MKDKDLRAILLQELYDKRSETHVQVGLDTTNNLEEKERVRIANQLQEHGLIKFKLLNPHLGGMASITADGVDVIEGSVEPPIAMTIDNRKTINVSGSHNVQIGDGNTLEVHTSIVRLKKYIEKSNENPKSKQEANNLLNKLLAHPLFTAIAGGAIGSL